MANPKGFIEWNPRGEYAEMLEQVVETVSHFRDYWPLTQRTWLYRLMARHGWSKGWECYSPSAAEKRLAKGQKLDSTDGGGLQRILDYGRRSGAIPWEAVQSKRGTSVSPIIYDSAFDMADTAASMIGHMCVDRQVGQDRELRIWLEADGLLSVVRPVATEFALPIATGQGFDTIDSKYRFAEAIARSDKPVTVLHIGDRDNSGESVHGALDDDVQAFVSAMGGELQIERIAVTDEQIDEYGLAWVPAKDDRSNHGIGLNVTRWAQAEAFEPPDLQALVRREIISRLDMVAYDKQLALESDSRNAALTALAPALAELEGAA